MKDSSKVLLIAVFIAIGGWGLMGGIGSIVVSQPESAAFGGAIAGFFFMIAWFLLRSASTK